MHSWFDMVSSFPGPAQLSVASSTEFSFACRESLGMRLFTWSIIQNINVSSERNGS